MARVAVFGNAGGGKSTLARDLAEITGLPLYPLDIIQFREGQYWPCEQEGGKLPPEEFSRLHHDILASDRWIIDGYGGVKLAWERFAAADTLVHVDLPLPAHYWGVTKRLATGLFQTPKGWPDRSPVWESSLDSYRVVWLCHRRLTPRYRSFVTEARSSKRVHHLTSRRSVNDFLRAVRKEVAH
jgi:adenylate kinase family enzyme